MKDNYAIIMAGGIGNRFWPLSRRDKPKQFPDILGTGNHYKVKLFHEKPNLKLAKKFIQSGDFFWNSGIFIWSAESIIKAFDEFLPEISSVFKSNLSILGTPKEDDFIAQVYPSFKEVSIDYSIMEKARNVYVITADMDWSDLGTWSSLYDHSVSDENRNSSLNGNTFAFESTGNLISVTPGKTVLIQGLHNYIVVGTGDAILIIKKQDEQKIKNYLEIIKQG